MNTKRWLVLMATVLAFAGANVRASTLTQTFANDYASNAIYLWSGDPSNLSFLKATFSGAASGWAVTTNAGSELVMSGSVLSPGSGLFDVKFKYQTLPFSLEWAEVLASGAQNTVLGSGTLGWNGSSWSSSNAFTHLSALSPASPVPLPAPFWLLGSALVGLICIGRRPHKT